MFPKLLGPASNMSWDIIGGVVTRSIDPYLRFNMSVLLTSTRCDFVRKAWDRVVSWYKNVMRDEFQRNRFQVPPETDFTRFVLEFVATDKLPHLRPQMYWILDLRGRMVMDFVGRFETLDDDWKHISSRIGMEDSELPQLVAGPKTDKDYRSYYNSTTKRVVAAKYKNEIERFGYAFHPSP